MSFQNLSTTFESIALEESSFALCALIACGLLCCFFGYRTTRILLDAVGFIALGLAAALLVGVASDGNLALMGVALLVGGVVGALLAHFVYRLGVSFLAGAAAGLIAWQIMSLYDDSAMTWVVVGASALSSGLLAMFFTRFFTSLSTAAIGAWFVARGTFALLEHIEITPRLSDSENTLAAMSPAVISWLVLAGVGLVFQLIFGKRKKDA